MSPTEHESISPSARILDAPTFLYLLAVAIFLYSFLFLPPFLPFGNSGDILLYLAPGQRMYQGETIYRDFLEFVTPGTALVYFFLFKLFGLRLWIPNLLSLLLGVGLAWLSVVIAKKLTRSSLALLPSAIFLAGVYQFLRDPVHHFYSLLATLAAIAVLMERRSAARIAAAGCLCGLSACFTQTRGLAVFMGFSLFLWWESRHREEGWRTLVKKEAWLITGFLATLTAVNGYFIWKAGPSRFLWCTVVFILKYYPKQANWNTFQVFRASLPAVFPLHQFLHWDLEEWLFLYAACPFMLILFFARYWLESGKKPTEFWERPMLVAIVGSFVLLSIAPSPSGMRMATSLLPGIILLVWFIDSPRMLARALAAAMALLALLVALHGVVRRRPIPNFILTTSQGKLALSDPVIYQEYAWIQQHTQPGQYVYAADFPDPYFILNLRNPTPLPVIANNGYTTPEQVAEVVRGLEHHQVHYIQWTVDLDEIPDWEDPADDHIGPLRSYLHSHYRVVQSFLNGDEIWEKMD